MILYILQHLRNSIYIYIYMDTKRGYTGDMGEGFLPTKGLLVKTKKIYMGYYKYNMYFIPNFLFLHNICLYIPQNQNLDQSMTETFSKK